jgi:hypothetical protein
MKPLFSLVFLFGFTCSLLGQEPSTLDDLKFYADIIANAGNPIHNERANQKFTELFDEWINSESYNTEDLESIQWLSVKQPADESFTLITWQLEMDKNLHKYFGYIVKDGSVFRLENTEFEDDLEYEVLSPENWSGALYYNIHAVEREGKSYYILFGYNGYRNYQHRKLADVLTFDSGKPVFGSEMFKKQEPGERGVIKNRLILDYSSDANVTLNYNPGLNMIVYDHLIPRMGRIPGQGPTLLPDGSYIGYEWDGEYFNYIDKIYHQTQDKPPMPKPVIGVGNKNKDIFGKEKKINLKKN